MLFILFATLTTAFAQVEMTVTITLKDAMHKPMNGVTLHFEEASIDGHKTAVTSGGGKATVVLTEGTKWVVRYKDVKEALVIPLPPRGTGSMNRTLRYDPGAAAAAKANDRTGMVFEEITQTETNPKAEATIGICHIEMKRIDGSPLSNFPVTLVSLPLKKKWHATTDDQGKVRFKVPTRQKYQIDVDGSENVNWIELGPQPYGEVGLRMKYEPSALPEEKGDTILQSLTADAKPSSNRIKLSVTMTNFDDGPLKDEEIFFRSNKTGKVYKAVSDSKGQVHMLLPHGSWYQVGFIGINAYDSLDYSRTRGIGTAELKFTWMGAKEYLRRLRARERALARRDSLYESGYYGSAIIEEIQRDRVTGMKLLDKRVTKIKEEIAKDPKYFEKADMPVCAVIQRMAPRWKPNKVIVNDLTGSMYPYMDQVLLWHDLNLQLKEKKTYFFFNDGDGKSTSEKVIGSTGGIYHTPGGSSGAVANTMVETMKGGGGGDGPENDVEALLKAQEFARGETELILVADNYSSVKDIELIAGLNVPVRVIVCGFNNEIHPDYITIAYRTKGSVHTIEDDIENIAEKVRDNKFTLAGQKYRIAGGRVFVE